MGHFWRMVVLHTIKWVINNARAQGNYEVVRKIIGWKISFFGIISSISGIGIIVALWNLIIYDVFSIILMLGLILCHLALIMFFEELIAIQSNVN
jgi:cytochrome b subunit of formate dehydrogenase